MFLNSFQVQGSFEASASTADTITTQIMTVDDLSSTYSPEESLAVLYQRDATGRRCHKTVKGGGEAVWPPNLEAALIAGLEVYSERHRAHMRHRGRFIGRNHFLSDYVKSLTGRRRSAKQVGSRLQQLKDTCRELEILYLITGSRTISPRRDSRRGKKSGSKALSQRSLSTSPELSDGSSEQTPEPQDHNQTPPRYLSCAEVPHQMAYCSPDAPIEAAAATYTALPQPECSYPNDQPQPSTTQYYSQPSQFYCQDWLNVAQPSQATYNAPSQQWVGYYPQLEPQPQSQQFVYYSSQYY